MFPITHISVYVSPITQPVIDMNAQQPPNSEYSGETPNTGPAPAQTTQKAAAEIKHHLQKPPFRYTHTAVKQLNAVPKIAAIDNMVGTPVGNIDAP